MKGGGGKGSKKDGVGGGLVCAHCKKVGDLDTMKRCGRCRRVCYCSVECQKLHWKKGGHKKVCGIPKEDGSGTSSDGVPGASGGESAALKHPCPICLDNEDDTGDAGMCYSCGHMFCGSCKKSLNQRLVTNCPTCRASLLVFSPKERVRKLRQLLARAAGRHTPFAQYNLGACYNDGTGVAQDYAEALRWYRLAADQGLGNAQFNIGVYYTDGIGVARDDAEAVRWYRLAADQGNASAQCNLGMCYAKGAGIAQDDREAVRWYRLSADQGDATAQANLGTRYQKGAGVAKDEAAAARWYRLAGEQGNVNAQINLSLCYQNGTGVAHDDAEVLRWNRLAADQGDANAQFRVGLCYARGTGVAQNEAEAIRWIRLAADQGYAGALTALTQLGM
jgi:TPR repeat protein